MDLTAASARTAGSVVDPAPRRDIFIVCRTLDDVGGVQRWAHRMAQLLAARGHRVRLVGLFGTTDPHDWSTEGPADDAALDGTVSDRAVLADTVLHPGRYGAPGRPGLAARVVNPLAVLRYRRWRAVQRSGAARLSALLGQTAEPATGVVVVAQIQAMEWVTRADLHGMPVIGISHESYAASTASSRVHRIKRYYPNVARFLSLTDQDAADWTRLGGLNNTGSMPNPLPFEARGGADPDSRCVVAIGRLSFEKGFDLLLEAWSVAVASRPGWTLRIYGGGPEQERLETLANSLAIADSVEFAGPTTEVAAALTEGSVFASASRAEGFPITLLEALACGLPCVAFDCAPGVRQLIHPGVNGALAAPGNTDELAAELAGFMDDPRLRAAAGRAAVESVAPYTPERIVERWEEVFALVHR
jgi:glycosyltransferase involved in cell wall biosynthesis